jgi:hypothetical protein
MGLKTNFSFEVQCPADARRPGTDCAVLMEALQGTLQQCLAAQDPQAEVVVSDSHRGTGHKIVELTSRLDDARLTGILESFSETHGVIVSALE